MEDIDRQIVRLLAADGRMIYTDLGKATGLSTSAVHQRVRRLEQRGVITGLRRRVDPEALGPAADRVRLHQAARPGGRRRRARQRLAAVDAIEACYSVAGEESYILKVRVASPRRLEQLLAEIRAAANVRTRTTVVLSTPYEHRPPTI